MFARLTFFPLALALLCSTARASLCDGGGGVDCCTTVYELDSPEAQLVLAAYNIDAAGLPAGALGSGCGGGGINIGGGSTCENIPVCCVQNHFGLIGVGCSPAPVSL